jgi:hypothetical protein
MLLRLLPYGPVSCWSSWRSAVVLAYTVDLSPWLGGGFGMFSTMDDGVNRALRVFLVRKGQEEEGALPSALVDLERRVRVLPSAAHLSALATAIAAAYADADERPETVRIEVWRTRFDANALTPRSQRLREFAWMIDHE